MSGKKAAPAFIALGALAAGAAAMLAVEIYHRPVELAFSVARLSLKIRGAREEICMVEGLPIHYYKIGQHGDPVVMIHGLGGAGESWVPLISFLRRDFLLYAPDMPGFGQTPLAPGKQCIATHVGYLEHFLDTLGHERVTLVGQSLGGWIALRYAARHPERVSNLYLFNSAGLMREGMFSPYAPDREAAKFYVKRISGYGGVVPTFWLDAIVKMSREPAFAQFIENYDRAEEVDEILANITVPTTIVWGTGDRVFPLRCAYDFHMGIPDSRLVLVPGVSHNSHVGAARKIARLMLEDATSAHFIPPGK